jgi:hypothetical protein
MLRVVRVVLFSAAGIIKSISFSKTIHSCQYVRCILTPFFEHLSDYKAAYAFFQLVNEFAHTVNNCVFLCNDYSGHAKFFM